MVTLFISIFMKFFFLLTPFFVMSTFLAITANYESHKRFKLALQVTLAVFFVCIIIFWAGNFVFQVFGITLNAFRIGTGILLLLTAISLVQGKQETTADPNATNIAVVPLAIPVTVGPATTGALLVMGGELKNLTEVLISIGAMTGAIALVGLLLVAAGYVERLIKKQGIIILSKITGLILAALAAQMIMDGVTHFLK